MPEGGASVAGITATLGAEVGKAREGMTRRRVPGAKPGSPLLRPIEADCNIRRGAATKRADTLRNLLNDPQHP